MKDEIDKSRLLSRGVVFTGANTAPREPARDLSDSALTIADFCERQFVFSMPKQRGAGQRKENTIKHRIKFLINSINQNYLFQERVEIFHSLQSRSFTLVFIFTLKT